MKIYHTAHFINSVSIRQIIHQGTSIVKESIPVYILIMYHWFRILTTASLN